MIPRPLLSEGRPHCPWRSTPLTVHVPQVRWLLLVRSYRDVLERSGTYLQCTCQTDLALASPSELQNQHVPRDGHDHRKGWVPNAVRCEDVEATRQVEIRLALRA